MNGSVKKMFSLLLSVIIIFSIFTVNVAAAFANSGNCGAEGNNVTYDFSSGILTIRGAGKMADDGGNPWYNESAKKTITSVVIESGVTSVGNNAFYRCSNIISAAIADSVTSIGDLSFSGCDLLTSINIPNSLTSIGYDAFYECKQLTGDIILPDSVTSIGQRAFFRCWSLTSINIPNSLTSIGYQTFYQCQGITNITIPDSVETIGQEAFFNCEKLESVSLGNSSHLKTIGQHAFQQCRVLPKITIPPTVETIGNEAFLNCNKLNEITILSKNANFGTNVFNGCANASASDFTIIGYNKSTAQAYAAANGHKFVPLDEEETPTPKPTSTPGISTPTSAPNTPSSAPANGTIDKLDYTGIITVRASMPEFICTQIISAVIPTNADAFNFVLDPDKLLAEALRDDGIEVDPRASLLFNNKDEDGNIIGMSGRSDPIKFINKGITPINATLTIKPNSTFTESASTLNLVKSRDDFNGTKANIYLSANVPEWEDIPIGTSTGAVINAMIPDSSHNFSIALKDVSGVLKFECEETDPDFSVWNELNVYITGEIDTDYIKWTDTSAVDPDKILNAGYTTSWTLTSVSKASGVMDTTKTGAARDTTIPLKGAAVGSNSKIKPTEKIYIKPFTISNRFSARPETECYDLSLAGDYITIKKDKIVLTDNFAQYCKWRWGPCKVLIYCPGTQGAIVAIK